MTDSHRPPGGDFFAAPVGSPPPAYQPPGYQPPASSSLPLSGPPPGSGQHLATQPGVPELVTIAYTLLAVFAAAGLYIGASLVSLHSDLSGIDGLGGYAPPSYGKEEFFFGGSGILGIALVVFMRSGSRTARGLASALSGAWGIWWLYELVHTTGSGAGILTGSFGMTGTVATLAALTVVAACAAIASLPWTPNVRSHFRNP